MTDVDRRTFLVGVGALAAALAVPATTPAAPAAPTLPPGYAFRPNVRRWIVEEIRENFSGNYQVRLGEFWCTDDVTPVERVRSSWAQLLSVINHVEVERVTSGWDPREVVTVYRRTTVDLTTDARALAVRPGDVVDFVLDDLACTATTETRV